MCAAIGVDPLASSSGAGGKEGGGSLWSQLLGGSVNDFYFELAVRVVEVCGETREENGGLIGVREVSERIMRTRMEGVAEITEYAALSRSSHTMPGFPKFLKYITDI
jgi:ESCRT-II complex subunit VPS22